jgi:hypothetical protein
MLRCKSNLGALLCTPHECAAKHRQEKAMISISRSMLLAVALLALPVAGAVAQQNDSAMKSSKDTTGYTRPTITTPTGDASMKGATVGDSANRAAAGATNSKADVGESTGPSGKQPK